MIMIPMIPGYVFVRSQLQAEEHLQILKTVGVVRMVGFRGEAAPANDEEISSLMILDGTDRTVQNRDYMKKGDRIIIAEGPLKGLMGFYLHHKGQTEKVVVSVELLHRSVEVEVEGWALERVP
jgi:transcription antitermination factor NusG